MILKSCVELQELNESVKALLSAEDAEKEQMNGGNPKWLNLNEWITNKQSEIDADECNDDDPQDGVFQRKKCSQKSHKNCSQKTTRSGRFSKHSVLSSRLKLESKRVELRVRAAGLEWRQELEKEEELLKARKENLDLETEIAANAAKLNIINEYEDSYIAQPQSMDMVNVYLEGTLLILDASVYAQK